MEQMLRRFPKPVLGAAMERLYQNGFYHEITEQDGAIMNVLYQYLQTHYSAAANAAPESPEMPQAQRGEEEERKWADLHPRNGHHAR